MSARIACTTPLALPTKIWLPITVGCANAKMSPSNPNAHFSFRRGTCAAVEPARDAGNEARVVARGLQPFQASHRDVAERHAAIGAVGLRPRARLRAGLAEEARNGLALVAASA